MTLIIFSFKRGKCARTEFATRFDTPPRYHVVFSTMQGFVDDSQTFILGPYSDG